MTARYVELRELADNAVIWQRAVIRDRASDAGRMVEAGAVLRELGPVLAEVHAAARLASISVAPATGEILISVCRDQEDPQQRVLGARRRDDVAYDVAVGLAEACNLSHVVHQPCEAGQVDLRWSGDWHGWPVSVMVRVALPLLDTAAEAAVEGGERS